MKYREIIVPLNKRAELELDMGKNEIASEKLILSEEEFYFLFDSGIFNSINSISGSLIDDYEDCSITDINNLINLIVFLENYEKGLKTSKSNVILKKLISKIIFLVKKAVEMKTGVYFFF